MKYTEPDAPGVVLTLGDPALMAKYSERDSDGLLGAIPVDERMALSFMQISAYVTTSLHAPTLGTRLMHALSAQQRVAAQQEQRQVGA